MNQTVCTVAYLSRAQMCLHSFLTFVRRMRMRKKEKEKKEKEKTTQEQQ
jgi:hypothetical protein